jgi:hypothetical protein
MAKQELKQKSGPKNAPETPQIEEKQPEKLPQEKIVPVILPDESLNRAKLATKLCMVMDDCSRISKDKSNPAFKYKYVSSDAILERVNPALVKAKLATRITLEVMDRQARTASSAAMWELVTVKATIIIMDTETGATLETEGIGQGYDGGDKALSKAQTQARKYAWMLALNISTGDDPENDGQTDRVQEPGVACKKCGKPSMLVDEGEDGIAGKYKEYACSACRNVFRVKA